MNPYFTVNDSEHFTFYRIPKLLFVSIYVPCRHAVKPMLHREPVIIHATKR